jgi:hypothetical protein
MVLVEECLGAALLEAASHQPVERRGHLSKHGGHDHRGK